MADPIKPLANPFPLPQATLAAPAAMDPGLNLTPTREMRADLLWGESGHGKDTQLWFAAWYVASVLGKKTLLLTGESLGTGMQMARDMGIVKVISIAGTNKPMDLVAGILKGRKWPIMKPGPNNTLVPDFKDPRAVINPDEIGLVAINSMTSLGDLFKQSMQFEGNVRLPMAPGKDKYSVRIDDMEYVGSAPTHIGFVHDRMYEYVVASTYLPVDKVLWTARQQLGALGEKKDKDGNVIKTGIPVFGPSLPGSAATAKVTSWFGGAYHLDKVQVGLVDDKRQDATNAMAEKMKVAEYEYRLYLERHYHPEIGVPFDVKNRLPAIINSQLSKPNGPTKGKAYIPCTETEGGPTIWRHTGINTVWEMEEQYKNISIDKAQAMLKDMLEKFK